MDRTKKTDVNRFSTIIVYLIRHLLSLLFAVKSVNHSEKRDIDIFVVCLMFLFTPTCHK